MRWFALLTLLAVLAGCNRDSSKSTSSAGAERGVLLLRYAEGSESTEQRERGFLETMAEEFPEIAVISQEGYAGATQNTALAKSQDLLNKYGPRLDGVFACNESSAGRIIVSRKLPISRVSSASISRGLVTGWQSWV